jgi:4-hydroxybenzoate polyprenyltransferase
VTSSTLVPERAFSLVEHLRLLRPHEWIKNGFVLAPLAFVPEVSRREWPQALVAAAAFCLISSAVYAVNDVIDAPSDRHHPRKRQRPVAAGTVRPGTAYVLAALAAAGAAALAATLPRPVTWLLLIYVANNVAYNVVVKQLIILDVMSIAVGFVLRLLVGASAIAVEPSSWLIVCGFSLALLLGFGKRRAELGLAGTSGAVFRKTLATYTPSVLDALLAVCSATTLLSYMLYTVAPETRAVHGTGALIWTTPFVAYGLFRFMFRVHDETGEGPAEIVYSDGVLLLNAVVWLAVVAAILLSS